MLRSVGLCDKVKGSSGGQNEAIAPCQFRSIHHIFEGFQRLQRSHLTRWQFLVCVPSVPGPGLPHNTRRVICSEFLSRWKSCCGLSCWREWVRVKANVCSHHGITLSSHSLCVSVSRKLWISPGYEYLSRWLSTHISQAASRPPARHRHTNIFFSFRSSALNTFVWR